MSGSTVTVPSKKGTSTLVRPKFGPGMLLQHEDLDQLSAYTRELSRLMFRSLFGCGVVCGLVVKTDPKCGQDVVVVAAGLGIDCAGDPIYVPTEQRVVIDENCEPNPNDVLWVVLCATVKCCAPRQSMCPSDDDDDTSSCTRERDGFEIRVVSKSLKCACSCVPDEDSTDGADTGIALADSTSFQSDCLCVDPTDPCYAEHYAGICGCSCDDGSQGGCCDCIVLARLDKMHDGDAVSWQIDHSVRRFIRPVLMRDPQVQLEQAASLQSKMAQRDHRTTTTLSADKTAPKSPKAAKTPKA